MKNITIIKEIKDLSSSDVALAGGKGASLGEMTRTGISVPPGFVILASAFEKFLEETDLNVEIDSILDSVDHKEMHTIEGASEKIKALILQAEMPKDIAKEIQRFFKNLNAKYVAVRSSATAEDSASAAWAGQLESYLNTTEENLLENVKKCWASLFTPRAIFYRFEKDLHKQKISVAVVVQKMVESEKSGIAFSVHPVTQDKNQLIIEAVFGLGEAIVSGQITPDSYVVEKKPRRIIDKNIQAQSRGLYRAKNGGNEWRDIPKEQREKQVLSDKEILELSEIILRIENHYDYPCDIEWAFENRKFYIVQSRPITTINMENQVPMRQKVEKIFSRDFSLIALQMDYLPESSLTRPWTKGENPFRPYLIFWRNDGTSKIYFNVKGVDWIKSQLKKQVKKDKNFLKEVESKVRKGISFIRPIYEAKKILNKAELIRFVNEFIAAYHWIEAMWWIKSMAKDELKDVDCSNIVKLREETEELSAATDIVIRKSLANLYPELGNLSAMISFEELRGDSDFDMEILKKRDAGFVLIDNQIVLDKTFQKVLDEKNLFVDEEIIDPNISILRGEKVSHGKYKGRAVRVMGHNDFEKVKSGDIIVSPMTMVDFLPIMEKAGAFITDEGGALCHAAIVARELRKPCVVGTNVATQLLRDGDIVEVDADLGIVKVFKK
jgi:phosphoenolpyruvate synthase/pyruvate phosphate dikinase